MPRKLRRPKARTASVPIAFQHYVLHGDRDAALAADPETGWLDLLLLCGPDPGRRGLTDLWATVRADLLAVWVQDRPGTRPWAWWELDAPPWTTDVPARVRPLAVDNAAVWRLKQPRRRLSGIGTPVYEALNYIPELAFGVPVQFVTAWDVSYYNGRSRDIHGQRIGTEYREGHFPFQAFEPADPPSYESEASYLDRHQLLSPGERRRLSAEAFEPERIVEADDDSDDDDDSDG